MGKVEWFKVSADCFNGTSFKFMKRSDVKGLRNSRDKLESVWFELLALAAKVNNEGYFYNDEVDYKSNKDIAIMLDRKEKEIELCMNFYLQQKMISLAEKKYFVTNFGKYQNLKGLEELREKGRLRQQKYRENLTKQEINENINENNNDTCNVTHNVTLSRDVDLDLEVDLEKEKKSITYKDIAQISHEISEPEKVKDENLTPVSKNENKKRYNNAEFERFYKAYPRKVGKAKVENWFRSHKPDSETIDKMVASIEEHKKLKQWQDVQYIPHPSVFLNQERWKDDLTSEKISGQEKKGEKHISSVYATTKEQDEENMEILSSINVDDILGDL